MYRKSHYELASPRPSWRGLQGAAVARGGFHLQSQPEHSTNAFCHLRGLGRVPLIAENGWSLAVPYAPNFLPFSPRVNSSCCPPVLALTFLCGFVWEVFFLEFTGYGVSVGTALLQGQLSWICTDNTFLFGSWTDQCSLQWELDIIGNNSFLVPASLSMAGILFEKLNTLWSVLMKSKFCLRVINFALSLSHHAYTPPQKPTN